MISSSMRLFEAVRSVDQTLTQRLFEAAVPYSGKCDSDTVVQLLNAGADINAFGGDTVNSRQSVDDEETILATAIRYNRPETVQFLLDRGANLLIPSHQQSGHSCLQQALGWPGTATLRLLLAAARARGQTAALLRMEDESGKNVFQYCAWRGASRGTTQLSVLCECFATREFQLPKVEAVYQATSLPRELAELVVRFTPFSELIDARDMSGRTPLMGALMGLNPRRPENTMECVKLLLQHGADPDARDKNGCTAFELCGFRIYDYRLRRQESPHQGWNPVDAELLSYLGSLLGHREVACDTSD